MSSLKGPDFQGCLSPAECGAEVWGTMKRAAAAERLFQSFDCCGGECFLPAFPLCSPCGCRVFPSAFALHQLRLGCSLPLLCFQQPEICSSALTNGSAISIAPYWLPEVSSSGNCNHTWTTGREIFLSQTLHLWFCILCWGFWVYAWLLC